MQLIVQPVAGLKGKVLVPGDKSISHRSLIFGSLAKGRTKVEGFLPSADCLSTLACFRALGVNIQQVSDRTLIIEGNHLQEPFGVLDAGNSGTTMRLLAGILAGQNFFSILDGDDSLRKRPMGRVVTPLRQMGALIDGREDASLAPLAIRGQKLKAINYTSSVASAQVKSAVLLAGLFAHGITQYQEPYLSRDHTERLLAHFGQPVQRKGNLISLDPSLGVLRGCELSIPGDISSAAFFMVAAACIPGSDLLLENVGVNPTRTGVIKALRQMGAHLQMVNPREESGELVADIRVLGGKLQGIQISGELIPQLIDEIPVLAVAACQAQGPTIIKDAGELRVKETDRISELVKGLSKLGIESIPQEDGLIIEGGQQIKGAVVDSCGDHRLAMSFAIAGLLGQQETTIKGFDCAEISFPGFCQVLEELNVYAKLSP